MARYLAPEYFMHGIVDEKTDIFAFGVLLLEIVTGRRPIDSSKLSLLQWVSIAKMNTLKSVNFQGARAIQSKYSLGRHSNHSGAAPHRHNPKILGRHSNHSGARATQV